MQPILPPPKFDLTHDPFLVLNQEAFEQLVTFIDFAGESFTLGFVSVNFAKDRDYLIYNLQQHPSCQEIQFTVIHLPDPELRFLRDALLEELPKRPPQPGKKRVVVLTGLEYAIGMVGNYPMVLQDLNYVRDAFTTSIPYPLLIYLPDSALTRLARYAPDFWAWRRGVFEFKSLESTIQTAYEAILESDQLSGNLDWEKQRECIDSLERLLMENNTSSQISRRVRILGELGKLYWEVGELHKAETVLNELLALTEVQEEFTKVRTSSLRELAKIYAQSGEPEKALRLYEKFLQQVDDFEDAKIASTLSDVAGLIAYQGDLTRALELLEQSLVIREQINDDYGKAVTLSAMADIARQQGDFERAIALWEKSLAIQNEISDLQGKTSTLNNIATVVASQGKFESACDLWQQSLQILEQISDNQGKAAVLNNMAGVIAKQGDVERALDLWQQSLKIKERIGDVRGKAATLNNMAGVIEQEDIDRALDLWQQSLEIKERIGDVQGEAATLSNMAQVMAKQGDIDRALDLWQQSLDIQERIGDAQGKATTLSNMARVIAYAAQLQSLADAAQDIKVLVNQYASFYDTTTPSGKMGISGKVIESIEKNPTLKSRTLNALKEAGKIAFEEAIDHPIAKVLVAALEGYLE